MRTERKNADDDDIGRPIVLDTNIWISSMLGKGAPHRLVVIALEGRVRVATSPELMNEFIEVASRPKFNLRDSSVRSMANVIIAVCETTKVKGCVKIMKDDPSDDVVLETAVNSMADAIVTGDRHLLALKSFGGIAIVTPRTMVDHLDRRRN